MAEYLHHSVLWRILRVIAGFFSSMVEGSLVVAAWKSSVFRRGIFGFLKSDDGLSRGSVPGKALRILDGKLAGWQGLGRAVHSSVFGRLSAALLRSCRNSRIVGVLFRRGITGVILALLGIYAGFDWLLRDVLAIPVVSAIWDEALLILAFVWVLWKRTDKKSPTLIRTTNLDFAVLGFVCLCLCLMIARSPDTGIAVAGYRAVCQYLLWFFVVVRLLRSDVDCKQLYYTMVLLATIIGLHGVYQYIVGTPIPDTWTDAAEADVRTRSFSIFGSPNILASYMVMFAPMAAGLAYATKNWKMKVLAWGITLIMCACCLFTMSRGGWVAMAVAVVVFALLVDRRLFVLVLVAGVVALFLPFVRSRLGYVFTDEFAESTAKGGRAIRWEIGLQHLRDSSPLFGFGLGRFGGAVAMQNQVLPIDYFYMDNYYMKTLVEIGYVGLSGFIFMMLSLVLTGCRSLYQSKQVKHGDMFPMASGIFAGLCGVLAHCYFENIFEEPYMMASFWILAAMLVYMGILRNRKQKI